MEDHRKSAATRKLKSDEIRDTYMSMSKQGLGAVDGIWQAHGSDAEFEAHRGRR